MSKISFVRHFMRKAVCKDIAWYAVRQKVKFLETAIVWPCLLLVLIFLLLFVGKYFLFLLTVYGLSSLCLWYKWFFKLYFGIAYLWFVFWIFKTYFLWIKFCWTVFMKNCIWSWSVEKRIKDLPVYLPHSTTHLFYYLVLQ